MSSAPTISACTEREIRVVQPRCERLIKAESSRESANIGALQIIRYLYGHRLRWYRRAECKERDRVQTRPEGTFLVAEVSANDGGGCVPCVFGDAGADDAGSGAGAEEGGYVHGS